MAGPCACLVAAISVLAAKTMTERFDRFSEDARRVLQYAQEESQRLRQNYIGTEHLLLGLMRQGNRIISRALTDIGVELPAVRQAVVQASSQRPAVQGDVGLTDGAKRVIERSVEEARRLNNDAITPEHMLVALLRGDDTAVEILRSLGASLEDLPGLAEDQLVPPLGAARVVNFFVKDLAAAREFYVDRLALPIDREQPGQFFILDAGSFLFRFDREDADHPAKGGGARLIFRVHDLDRTARRLGEQGIMFEPRATPDGARAFLEATDPEGYRLVFTQTI
jgi:catechol 2,3-dioxygenase-like lactoylglutathione lyase family enzyme